MCLIVTNKSHGTCHIFYGANISECYIKLTTFYGNVNLIALLNQLKLQGNEVIVR